MEKTKKEDGRKTRKNKGGRLPKYATKEALKKAVDLYLDSCFEETIVKVGKGKDEENKVLRQRIEMPNKAGLCYFLGISRDVYGEYKKKFPDTIKEIEAVIENAWVQRLWGNSPTGAIFYLKNAFRDSYKDRHETDITTGGDKITGIEYVIPKANETKDRTHA
jgi:hypothetical protein